MKQVVISLIAKKIGLPPARISPESRLLQDLGMDGDDAEEFLLEYSEVLGVDMSAFKFSDHFRREPHLFNRWRVGRESNLVPITVRDLMGAAKQKRWIIPRSTAPYPKDEL